MPSSKKFNQSPVLRGSSPSFDHSTGIIGPTGEGKSDTEKPSSSSLGVGLLSSGFLIAVFAGGLVIFKKRNGQLGNDRVFNNDERDTYFEDVFYNSDSDSDSDDCYFDKNFDESTQSMEFNICIESS